MTAPRIYIAGMFEARSRLVGVKDRIELAGYTVLSSWLDETSEMPESLLSYARSLEYARRDLSEIRDCGLFMLDTFDRNHRGGREVEYGYALALHREVVLVGPERNVFHYLAEERFYEWATAIEWLMRRHSNWEAYGA